MKTTVCGIAVLSAAVLFALMPFDAEAQNRRTGSGGGQKTEKTTVKSDNSSRKQESAEKTESSRKSSGSTSRSVSRDNSSSRQRVNTTSASRSNSSDRSGQRGVRQGDSGGSSRRGGTVGTGSSRNSGSASSNRGDASVSSGRNSSTGTSGQDRKSGATSFSRGNRSGSGTSASSSRDNANLQSDRRGSGNTVNAGRGDGRREGTQSVANDRNSSRVNVDGGSHNRFGSRNGDKLDFDSNGSRPGRGVEAGGNRGSSRDEYRGDNRPMQYHNNMPEMRKSWDRPYMDRRHEPMPPYRYGDHFFGYSIHALPRGCRRQRFGDIWFYYNNGIFYRNIGSYYYICRPPVGVAFTVSSMTLSLTAVPIDYYYSDDERVDYAMRVAVEYDRINRSYNVPSYSYMSHFLPRYDRQYYYDDGVFYVYSRGRYYVTDAPLGALVTSIPYDYYTIVLGGMPFYRVDDTLYQDIEIDGALYFEVVCNL